MTMPAWLQRHLENTGRLNADGIRRNAHARTCTRCGCTILTGLDANTCALAADADPTPISPLGEAVALLAGSRTYDLVCTGQRTELNHRDRHNIAGPRRWPVLASHRCGTQWPADPNPPIPLGMRHPQPTPEGPPF